ncbi:uncharacterized protein ARMOST_21427 [Armillaria ostoyae]|uniref:N-acetyltransferase domain-containing protein n=1 Tax=Armillaria ostoyae TaxID=47428 RepID=A0A284SA25_ARMOS|nr:uncharacterized protein ARMOST_21427 [Armillaria ostoyae]
MPATNFCFPLPLVLENEHVKLVTFDISVHPKLHVDAAPQTSFYDFLPVGPFNNEQELIASFWEKRINIGAGETAFAIYDKSTSEHAYTGIITYKNTSAEDLVTEIGFLMILPAFQRTHLTSNAVGILMNYALHIPADGGLAKRLGFQMEGVLRWANAWPEAKICGSGGVKVRKEDPRTEEFAYGRNLAILSVCWDDWEAGVKTKVKMEVARTK